MTTIDDLFPSPYLAAIDVESKPFVTIKKVIKKAMRNRDGEEEQKPVIFFNEFDKGMVLNKTNADIIVGLHGRVIDGWIGQQIQLHSVIVEAFGKRTPAIRVVEGDEVDVSGKPIYKNGQMASEFWSLAYGSFKFTEQDGQDHLAACGNDFKLAIEALRNTPAETA